VFTVWLAFVCGNFLNNPSGSTGAKIGAASCQIFNYLNLENIIFHFFD